MDTLKVYGDSRSGNCYKVKLVAAELGIDYEWQEVDVVGGETRTPEFLGMNPNDKIPLLASPDGRYLLESNAIIAYFADEPGSSAAMPSSGRRCCNGCSSSSTATSRTSPPRVSS